VIAGEEFRKPVVPFCYATTVHQSMLTAVCTKPYRAVIII